MELKIYHDYQTLSEHAADEILQEVKNHPHAVICLASGDTPRLTYRLMVEKSISQKVDFKKVTFIGLDEWMGIPPENEGSCHYFLYENIFKALQIEPNHIHLFDGLSTDPEKEVEKMNSVISHKGGLDLMVVGVGMNGHIGFNEPGVSPDLYAHVAPLDEITKSVGQKYFKLQTSLTHGITLGLKHFMQSEKVILIANGEKKAPIIQRALEGNISTEFPASLILRHPNPVVMIDQGAASLLNK